MIPPKVGAQVLYYNAHGFRRAAIVTGTMESLLGEKHVSLISVSDELHLVVFSPLPRTYHVQHVPRYSWSTMTDRIDCWEPL